MFDQNPFVLHAVAKAAISRFLFVKRTAVNDEIDTAGANERTVGVGPDYDVALGEPTPFASGGVAQLLLGATVTGGDNLKSDATGRGVKVGAASTKQNVGAIAQRSGVINDVIPVQIVIFQEDT